MRLRLTVQRNGLPAANILWSVPDTNSPQAYTITRLLEDINHIIPLEAEHWGLEHYVVEVAGFECLHFSPVAQALKEDDLVSIRPLMTAEVRARTLTGRHQISDGGQHLIDGVPFGRPYLRHPHRPALRIPPRKRRRLDDAEVAEAFEAAGLLTANGEVKEQEGSSSPINSGARSASGEARPRQTSKPVVQFEQPQLAESDDSDEDDDDFAPEGDSDNDVSMDNDSDNDSGTSSSASDTSDSDAESSSDSDSDSESEASSPPDVLSSKGGAHIRKDTTAPQSPKRVPPGEGRSATRSRNARRTRANRLRHLKESGVLHEDAGLSDLQKYEEATKADSVEEQTPSKPFSKPSGKRKRLEADGSTETEVITEDVTELEQRKRELMARFGEGRSNTPVQADEPVQAQVPVAEPDVTSTKDASSADPPIKVSKRLRPDTTAISRILARQAARPAVKKAKIKPAADAPPEPEGASDPDFWKSRINLSAFECWEEDFELSTPPFPFQQHWDPSSKLMRDKASKKKQKKGGRKDAPRDLLPTEEEEEEGEKIILDYDDAPATENPDAEINAAIEDQLRQDVATAAQSDLPPPPEDIGALPDLASSDIKEGAVIVCKFFAVNPITVTPEISEFKTAVVEREGDSGNGAGTLRLKIAARDLPKREKKFDSKGNRVYDAAHAFLMEDEDEDEGLWEGQFSELLEPKLLKAA